MKKNTIQVYGRLKPLNDSEKQSEEKYCIQVSDETNTCFREKLILTHKLSGELINNKPVSHTFRFCKVFDQHTNQKDVFARVAQPVVDSVLEGYNGTVFAYGQTGSGKTHSIIGGLTARNDRGMIPRSIEYIFNHIGKVGTDTMYVVSISFCEIYNDCGYDLLDPKIKNNNSEEMQRVYVCEDVHGNFTLRNLSLMKVASKEAALECLFSGDNLRVTAETPMNARSSRSHCVFTIHLDARDPQSPVVRHSKLNLVDLSGSERVYKSCINGKTLEEAKHINQSLHFLEQVIVSLSHSDKRHVPYRNSMMTTVLKDSLGGNCLTTMLATLSLNTNNIGETVSTCRFAQRVALIKTEATVNESIDPAVELQMLRCNIIKLQSELSVFKDLTGTKPLSREELSECEGLVTRIINNEEELSQVKIPMDGQKIRKCFGIFKNAILQARHEHSIALVASNSEIIKYQDLLRKRDEKIDALQGTRKDGNGLPLSATRREEKHLFDKRCDDERYLFDTRLDEDSVVTRPKHNNTNKHHAPIPTCATTTNTFRSSLPLEQHTWRDMVTHPPATSKNNTLTVLFSKEHKNENLIDDYKEVNDSYTTSQSKLICSLPLEQQQKFQEYLSQHPCRTQVRDVGEKLRLKVDRVRKLETDIADREGKLANLRNAEKALSNRLVESPRYKKCVKPYTQKLEHLLGDSMIKQCDLNQDISHLEYKADEKLPVLMAQFQQGSKLDKVGSFVEETGADVGRYKLPESLSSPARSSASPDPHPPRSLIMDDFMGGCNIGLFRKAKADHRTRIYTDDHNMDIGDSKNIDLMKVQGHNNDVYGNSVRRNLSHIHGTGVYCTEANDVDERISKHKIVDETDYHIEEIQADSGKSGQGRLKIMTNSEHVMLSDAKRGIYEDVRRTHCKASLPASCEGRSRLSPRRTTTVDRYNMNHGLATSDLGCRILCSVSNSNIVPEHKTRKQTHSEYSVQQPLDARNGREAVSGNIYVGYPVNKNGSKSCLNSPNDQYNGVGPDSRKPGHLTEILLTGDAEVDEAIIDFYRGQNDFIIIKKSN